MATCVGTVGALQYLIGRAEVNYSEYDAGGADVPVPVYDDGFTLRMNRAFTSQPFKVGRRGDKYRSATAVDVAGQLVSGLFPTTLTKALLDYAMAVDALGCLTPWSWTWVTPGIETLRFLGAYVNQLTLAASDGSPDLMFTADLTGRSEQQISEPALPTYPNPVAYQFQYGSFLASLDNGTTFGLLGTVDSFQLQLDNQLQLGPHAWNKLDYNNLTRSFINTGIQRMTGSIVVQYSDDDIGDMLRAGTRGELRLFFLHPESIRTQVNNVAGHAAGAAVNIVVNSSAGFVVGQIVMFVTTDSSKTSAAKITAIPDPTHITVDVLDFDIVDDDFIYNKALELRVDSFDVPSAPVNGGLADSLKQTMNFEVVDAGAGLPFTYKAPTA